MRDIVITLIVGFGCLWTLKRPYIGILLWSWLGYMNPHRLAYGFAYNMKYAQITAIVLFVSMLFSKQKKWIPMNSTTGAWLFFIFFMWVTTNFAYFEKTAWTQFEKVFKIQLVTILTMMLISDMAKLRQLIWVIVISIGYYSVKGGIFTVLTGGGNRVYGPPGSFIEENNSLAVAILIVIPLMVYLYQTTKSNIIKLALFSSVIISLFTVLGSQSRGALLAIMSVGGFYWFKSDNKIISGIFIVIMSVALLAFMPESWYERMNTISEYEEDGSAMGRLNAWEYAINGASDNLLGMGFNSWKYKTFAMYAPNPLKVHAAHSIYFSVLADHGWIGLFLFLFILFGAWKSLKRVLKLTRNDEQLKEYQSLAKMLQVSFIAYLSGGAFLSLSYFDLPWHLISFAVLMEFFLRQKEAENTV